MDVDDHGDAEDQDENEDNGRGVGLTWNELFPFPFPLFFFFFFFIPPSAIPARISFPVTFIPPPPPPLPPPPGVFTMDSGSCVHDLGTKRGIQYGHRRSSYLHSRGRVPGYPGPRVEPVALPQGTPGHLVETARGTWGPS
eukprot:2193659-Rhodomonas_salina.1